MLNGIQNPADYGKLVSWNDTPEAFDWSFTQKQFLPGHGLLVLEIQGRLLEFLVKCSQQLLHDIGVDQLLSSAYPVLPEPPAPAATTTTSLVNSLADLAEESPYRLPRAIDLGRIEYLLQGRVDQAVDHMWALREDPGYLAEQYLQYEEHRWELIPDVSGAKHPVLMPSLPGIYNSRIVRDLVFEACHYEVTFSELLKQCQEVKRLHGQYSAQLRPLDDLPEPYLQAILKFRHYLNMAAKDLFEQIRKSAAASPPLRKYWVRKLPQNIDLIELMRVSDVSGRPEYVDDLLWFLQTLWEDGDSLFLLTTEIVVDCLSKFAETEAQPYVSNHIGNIIADLSIIAEFSRQLNSYYPWSLGYENALVDREEAIHKGYTAYRVEGLGKAHRALNHKFNPSIIAIAKLGNPAHNRFLYPVDRRRSKENVDKLRQAEANLDEFWEKLEAHMRRHGYPLLPPDGRTLQRTPEWVAPVKKAAPAKKAVDVASLDLHIDTSPTTSTPQPALRTKTKTRGTAKAPTPSLAAPEAAAAPDTPPLQFAVDARSLKVFRLLFFTPNVNDTPGEAPWIDFVHAMNGVGFEAKIVYGSVWQFQPTDPDDRVTRSIQFHEPHPVRRIPFRIARRMGRRLTRTFGWSAETFTLLQK